MYAAALRILCALFFLQLKGTDGISTRDDVIDKLLDKIAKSQIKETVPYVFPVTLYKQKGVYPSYVHFDYSGTAEDTVLRREFKIFDNNAFVTLWVSSILLETVRFNKAAQPSDKQILSAIQAISSYHDKNFQNETRLVFWPQTYNETAKIWSSSPVNLDKAVELGDDFLILVGNILKDLDLKKYYQDIKILIEIIDSYTGAFYIPADFDDTFVNIGFGSLLKNYQSVSQQPYLSWLSNNTNSVQSAVKALKEYSYKPFNSSSGNSYIDPRTYFYLRKFLQKSQGTGQLSLVTTWIESLNESRANYYKKYRMPFNINNVDLTVSANVLYGLTAAVLSDMQDPNSWFDEEVQMIYLNTTSLVMYEISNNFSSRPDLALTYYPSVFNFYWFTSRILNLLNSYDQLPYPVMQTVKMRMSSTLRGEGTNDILRRATRHNDFIYFDDFLGDNDENFFGERVNRGDDRISSTAMAVNALFYIWANAGGVLLPNTPEPVTYTLLMACHWLADNALSDKLEHMNVFFSGSVKLGSVDIPFFYPLNYIERVNGSSIPPDYHFLGSDSDVLSAVIGTIQEDKYKELLEQIHYGYKTPTEFHGFNSKHVPFPFWSSTIFTDASSALALTQCTLNSM